MTPGNAWLLAAQWGSYMRAGDPGACMYGFDHRGMVQTETHRKQCLDWIDNHCARWAAPIDLKELSDLREYIAQAPVERRTAA